MCRMINLVDVVEVVAIVVVLVAVDITFYSKEHATVRIVRAQFSRNSISQSLVQGPKMTLQLAEFHIILVILLPSNSHHQDITCFVRGFRGFYKPSFAPRKGDNPMYHWNPNCPHQEQQLIQGLAVAGGYSPFIACGYFWCLCILCF